VAPGKAAMTTTSADVIRAAVYERVSTKDQSLARQQHENREAAARRGWSVTQYQGEKLSASGLGRHCGGQREEWARLLRDLDEGRIDVLVLNEPSRGDRRLTGWSALLDLCQARGVLIHIASEDYTYDPRRDRDWEELAQAGLRSAAEVRKLRKRVQSGKDEGMRQGRPQGSVAYGVRRVWDHAKSRHAWLRDEPDPETAPVVRRIVAEVAAGRPFTHIARDLDADGVPTETGAPAWHITTVRGIAANDVYVSAGVVTEAEHLAARARLARSKRTGERPARQLHRFGGCLRCAVCGQAAPGVTRDGGPRYRCPAGHVSIRTAEADAWIDALAVERLSRPDLLPLFAEPDNGTAAAAWAEAARHRQALADAAASYAAGRLPLAALEALTTDLEARAVAEEQRARDAETPTALTGLPDRDRAVVAERWATLTTSARKAALRALAPDAELRPGTRGHAAGGSGRHGGGTPVSERVVLWPGD
jgi:site-specific DNA recombinase